MKIKIQPLFASAVLLTGSAAFAQDAVPDADPMDPSYEAAPLPEEEDDYVAPVDRSDAATELDATPQQRPTIVSPVIIDADGDDDATAATPPPAAEAERPNLFGRRPNFGGAIADVKVGIGTGDFTQETARDQTGIGPSWDVRGVIGAHSPIGFEAAYTGSSRGINSGGGNTDDWQLVSNGVEGDLRIAAPLSVGEVVDVRPFAFGGLGWQYMTQWGDGPVDEDNDEGDHIMTIPAGVGLELGIGPVNVDVRGTYRHAVGSDLFGDATAQFDDPEALHSFNVGAGLGFEF
jgi:hypothetical protein